MGKLHLLGTILLATVLGEVALILLTTVAQEVMFDGIDYYTSALGDIFFGGLATFIAAVFSGMLASLIVRGSSVVPHGLISAMILAETAYLMSRGLADGPFWFSLISGLSLMVGVWAGHYATQTFIYKV